MTNVIRFTTQRFTLALLSIAFAVVVLLPSLAQAATLNRELDLGVSGTDVSTLQTFLSLNSERYPSGLVTGYYGQLTKAGVERFQADNNIVTSGTPVTTGYGRVGPRTLVALNAQINGNVGGDVYTPVISNLHINTEINGATITWNTAQSAIGTIHYQTSVPSMTEGSATSRAVIGGAIVTESEFGTAHSVRLTNLQSNTRYYYVVESVDASGNQMIKWPTTFKTL